MKPMSSKDVVRLLEDNGWVFERAKGSHHQFRHPEKSHVVTVPHPKKELGVGLVKAILRQAGIGETR